MRAIPNQAVTLVVKWEDCALAAYPDPATGGEPITIGYGHTGRVKLGDRVTKLQARTLLVGDLKNAARTITERIGAVVDELTENQYAALLSLVFNVGGEPAWTIWRRLRARQFDQVPGEFIKFVNAGGRKIQGLVNRRTDEIRLWSTDEPGSVDVVFTSATLRATATPPTPSDPVPAHRSAGVWAAITAPFFYIAAKLETWASLAPDFIKQSIAAVDPFSDKSPLAHGLVQGLSTAAAALGLWVAINTLRRKKEGRS